MQKDPIKKQEVLDSPKYLKYSSALAYKSGLDRNDGELLSEIDKRAQNKMSEFFIGHKDKIIEDFPIESGLIEASDDIESEIRRKNNAEDKDAELDSKYLTYDEDNQDIEEREQYDDVIQLITLHSDIIRNTREIDTSLKKHYITNSVNNYVGLMWEALDTFKDIVANAGTDKIEEVLLFKKGDKGRQTATEELIKRMERIVFQIIPVSVIEYMSEHLENPKLKRPVRAILKEETVLGKKLFYTLLLLTIDLDSGIDECKNLIHNSESYVVDQIVFIYSIIYSLEHKLEESEVEKMLDLLDSIRKKYAGGRKDLRPLVRDTFRSDIRKMILLKTVRKEK